MDGFLQIRLNNSSQQAVSVMAVKYINLVSLIRTSFATVDRNVRRKTATTHTAKRWQQFCKKSTSNMYEMNRHLTVILILLFFLTTCSGQNCNYSKTDVLSIKDTAFVPSDSNQFYFPLEVFRDTSIFVGYDTFVVSWYSEHLFAMREPIFYSDKSQKEIFRFTWLRTFHNPVAIRIEKLGDTYILYWKLCNGAGGYEPGELIINKQKEINKLTWDEFQKRLNEIEFWKMDTNEEKFGLDGSQWILEGKNLKHYHIVDRWTPSENSKYYQCCDFLIGLTDLEIKDGEKY
jgi:hypothetical protein